MSDGCTDPRSHERHIKALAQTEGHVGLTGEVPFCGPASPRRVPEPRDRAPRDALANRDATYQDLAQELDPLTFQYLTSPLPGTYQEAEAIQRQLPQVQFFPGREATRERLPSLPTHIILHLATYGFLMSTPVPLREVLIHHRP